jgi:hypothetical protein
MSRVIDLVRRLNYTYTLTLPWLGWFAALMLDTAWFKWLFCSGWISLLCFQMLAGGLQWEGHRRRSILWSLLVHVATLGLLAMSQSQQASPNLWAFLVETALIEQGAFLVGTSLVFIFLNKPDKDMAIPGIIVILVCTGATVWGLWQTLWDHIPIWTPSAIVSICVAFLLNVISDFRIVWALGNDRLYIGDMLDVPAILIQILIWGLLPLAFFLIRG